MTRCIFFAPNQPTFTISLNIAPNVGDEVLFTINARCSTGPQMFSGKVTRRVFISSGIDFYCDGAW